MSDFNDGLLPTPCLRMDTHFGDEYESVEFGDGTGYIKAAPILAKVGALHEEIDRLRDESAKLRELAQNLRRVTPLDVVGVVIGANTDHPSYYKFDKAFRELGIEVDA